MNLQLMVLGKDSTFFLLIFYSATCFSFAEGLTNSNAPLRSVDFRDFSCGIEVSNCNRTRSLIEIVLSSTHDTRAFSSFWMIFLTRPEERSCLPAKPK